MLQGEFKHLITIKEVINTAIENETMGYDFFLHYSEEFQEDQEIHDMFEVLAKEELEHCRRYKKMLKAAITRKMTRIPEYHYQQMKKWSPGYFCVYDQDNNLTIEAAMEGALKFEEKTLQSIKFLNEAFGSVSQLERIIKCEEEHIKKLKTFIQSRKPIRRRPKKKQRGVLWADFSRTPNQQIT